MKMRRSRLLVEPPSTAAPDIAFTMIVFFLVCASVQPETGRPQNIPRSEETADKEQQSQNIEVSLTDSAVLVNGDVVAMDQFPTKLRQLLAGKESESDRVVIVKSAEDATYQRWIDVTSAIEDAGGIVTLQLEQKQTVIVN
jgi:biopolymer transport protein ExbD